MACKLIYLLSEMKIEIQLWINAYGPKVFGKFRLIAKYVYHSHITKSFKWIFANDPLPITLNIHLKKKQPPDDISILIFDWKHFPYLMKRNELCGYVCSSILQTVLLFSFVELKLSAFDMKTNAIVKQKCSRLQFTWFQSRQKVARHLRKLVETLFSRYNLVYITGNSTWA